jgi:hypothetical protein
MGGGDAEVEDGLRKRRRVNIIARIALVQCGSEAAERMYISARH